MSFANNSEFDDNDLDLGSRPSSVAHAGTVSDIRNCPRVLRIPSVLLGPFDSSDSLGNSRVLEDPCEHNDENASFSENAVFKENVQQSAASLNNLEEILNQHLLALSEEAPYPCPESGGNRPRAPSYPLGLNGLYGDMNDESVDESKVNIDEINNPMWAPFGFESLQEKEFRVNKETKVYNALPADIRRQIISGVMYFDGKEAHIVKPNASRHSKKESDQELSDSENPMPEETEMSLQEKVQKILPEFERVSGEDIALAELRKYYPESEVRAHLNKLNKFIFGNSNRKMLSSWLIIESKFNKSPLSKSVLMKNPSTGLTYTVLHKAMSLSSLMGVLCSTRVKLKHTDVASLFECFGSIGMDVSNEEIFYCRCLAAARAILAHDARNGKPVDSLTEKEIDMIIDKSVGLEEKIISLEELKDIVFAKEPHQRQLQLGAVEKQRESSVAEHIEEKKRQREIAERAEFRKAKATADFKSYLREIQFSKGIITATRLDTLHSVINGCHKMISEVDATSDVRFPLDLVELLGIDCFPLHTRKSLAAPAVRKASHLSRMSSVLDTVAHKKGDRIGYEGQFRIPLAGDPTLLELIKHAVSFGRGLRGMSYRDVVELLQAYSSTRIQAFVRGYLRRYRFAIARRKWTKIFLKVKRAHFGAWAEYYRAQYALRRYCWRKVKVWRAYRVKCDFRRTLFRQCFWPFFIWRRYAQRLAKAREKVKFLVGRVIPTIWRMKVFRGWKSVVRYKVDIRQRAEDFKRAILMENARGLLVFLNGWARQNRLIRRCWFKDGLLKLKKNIYRCKNTPFQIWHAYIAYRRLVTVRSRLLAPRFFRLMFPNVPFKPLVDKLLRKKKMRAAWIRAEKEERKRLRREEEAASAASSNKKDKSSTPGQGRSKSAKDRPSSALAAAIAEAEAANEEKEPSFDWFVDIKPSIRIDVDEEFEDDIEIPQKFLDLYNNEILMLTPAKKLPFLTWIGNSDSNDINGLREGFVFEERWALIESALRFHKFGRRCFNNLRAYAKIRRNASRAIGELEMKRKAIVFHALYIWMKKDAGVGVDSLSVDISGQTEAEKLSNIVRNSRLSRLLRRRGAINEMKELGVVDEQEAELDALLQPPKKAVNAALRIASALYPPKKEKVISVPVYSALLGGPILPLRSTSPTQAMVKEEYCLVDDVVENDVLFINNSGSSKKLASGVDLESSYVLSHKSATSEHNQVSRPSSRSHTSNGRKGSSAHGRSSHGQNSRGQSTHSRGHSSHGPPGGELDELISVSVPTDKSSDVDGSELSSRPSSVSGTNSRPNSNCDRPSGSPCHRHAPQTFVDCNNNDRGSPQSTRESTKKGNRGSSRKNEAHLGTREERLAKILTKHELIIWDKEDRGQVLQHAEEMCALSSTLLSESQSITIAADEVTATAQAHKAKEADLLSVILRNEDKATTTAVDNEFKYVSSFKVHAADNLIGVLAKVYREVTLKMIKSETRRYFRALRGPLSEKLSVAMFNRKKISNWLRLCNRLTSINKRIPLLRKLRSMWVIFNRWLKLVEIETLNVSPGLVAIVRRRCELLPRYSQMLAAKGIKDVVYVNSKHLAAATSEFSALFLRWQMCVQEKGLFRILKVKAAQLFRLKLMSKVFFALRYHMRHEDTQCLRQFNVGFPIIRLQTDMDQVCKRFCALRRFGLQHIVGSYNRKFIACQAVDAKNALSFKRFLAKLKSDVASRLTIEQRVLSESFDSRGMQEFLDVRATKNLPNSMSRIDGKRFSDPYISGDDQARGCWVPGGYKLSTIRLNMQENMGIVGWQLAWSADSAKEINSPRRGKWMGAAMTVHEIHIPSDDYLQGVEYLYDGSLIVGLRLRYIWGGWSKWVGGKTSMSTLPLYLHCNMPPVEEFESSYVPAGYDEETCPGMPRSYVIGFTGLTSTTTKASTCLGLVVRKIISQHLFSYSWVQDAVDIQEITRDIDPNEEGTYEELQRNSDNDEDGEDDDLVNWGDADGDASERRDTLKLPPLPTKGLSRGNSTIQNTSRPSARPSARVASSRNSARSSSRVGESGGKRTRKASLAALKRLGKSKVATKLWQSMGSARGDGDEEMSLSDLVVKQVQEAESEDGDSLLNSERQFFDVIRMRITETNAAENRAEQFARRLWSKKEYRESKELSVMTSINILSHLTKWYFQAICRRLSRTCKTESEGTKLLSESQRLAVRAENATKRSELNASAALELESTRQPWMKSIMLSPVERAEKKKYLDDIHSLKAEAKADELLAKELTEESAKMLRRGKELLPRLQLSKYVCNYYRLKILAARHMQSLLQRMDLHTLKNQLSGNSAQGGGFSSLEMDIIRSSLRRREPEPDETETLDDIVNLEVGKQTATMLSKLQNSACRTHLRNQKSLDDSSVAEKLMLNLTGPPELSHSSVGSYGSGIHGSGLNAANSHLSLGSSSGRGLAFELTEAQQLKNQEDAERKEREKAAERERNMLKRSMPPKIVVKHLKKNKHKFGKPKTVALTPPPLSSANGEEGKNIILSKSLTHIPVTTTSATQKAWHSVIASHAVDNDVGVREAAKEIVVDVAIPLPKSTASKGKKVRAITSGDIDDNSTCGSTASDGGASSGTAASTNGARTIRRKKTVTIDA